MNPPDINWTTEQIFILFGGMGVLVIAIILIAVFGEKALGMDKEDE